MFKWERVSVSSRIIIYYVLDYDINFDFFFSVLGEYQIFAL